MKKLLFVFFSLICYSSLFAQHGSAAIKLGEFFPSSSGSGFIIGYEGAHFMDENLTLGWSVDWFHESYVDKQLVAQFNDLYGISGGEINELRAKTNLHDFPLMGVLTAKVLVAPYTKIYFTGALGGEVLFISYSNFENPSQDDFLTAFDFNWRVGFGTLYQIGRRSDIFAEVDYHHSAPSWQYDTKDPMTGIKRTFEREIDMSGVMLRVGFRFYY